MPKKFNTPKGVRQFPDNFTTFQIETELDKEGIDEYRPYEGMGAVKTTPQQQLETMRLQNESPTKGRENRFDLATGRYEKPEDLAPLNTLASFIRPFLAKGGAKLAANTIGNALPHPAAKLAAKAAGYFLTDQTAQEGQKQVFGQRPMGLIEQTAQPENDFLGRVMGTAENAALDFLPAGLSRAYGKMKGAPAPAPKDISQGINTNDPAAFRNVKAAKPNPSRETTFSAETVADTGTPFEFRSGTPPTNRSAGIRPEIPSSGIPSGAPKDLGTATTYTKGSQLSGTSTTALPTSNGPKLLGKGPDRIIELPGAPARTFEMGSGSLFDQFLPNTVDALKAAPVKMKLSQLSKVVAQAKVPVDALENTLNDPRHLSRMMGYPETAQLMKGYWGQKTIQQSYNAKTGVFDIKSLQQSLADPRVSKIYTPSEVSELKRFFNIIGNGKGKTGDIKVNPEGIILSGAVLAGLMEGDKREDEVKSADMTMLIPLAVMLGMGGRGRAAKQMLFDTLEGAKTSMPVRKWSKYVLRSALAGTDALLQKRDGTTEEIKMGN